MYPDFNKRGRDLFLGFINHFFPNKEKNWIKAKAFETTLRNKRFFKTN